MASSELEVEPDLVSDVNIIAMASSYNPRRKVSC